MISSANVPFRRLIFAAALWLSGATGWAGQPVDYLKEIKPLLSTRCYSCHGVLKQKAGLRLETRSLQLKGGESGPVIVAGDAEGSPLFQRITAGEEDRMPPKDEGTRLSEAEVELVRSWINQGAAAPDEPVPSGPRDHWAFQKPVRRRVPGVADGEWARNPIDAFVAAGHAARDLTPVPVAEPGVLLRRLYLDLTGLPPTRAETRAFVAEPTPEAYDRAVTELLGRPQHGERWGRHWMDVWRYADWFGLGEQLRNSQKHLWHWRDWIIESLNEDKGYDRMILEMLAADELWPTDLKALRGTGFLARQYYLFNRDTWLEETIEHTAKAFLGLTMNCAKCHDHKYDPISQIDYYRMRAFFEPYQVRLDTLPGETDLEKDGLPRVFDAHPEAPTYRYIRGDAKNPDKTQPLTPGLPAVFGLPELELTPLTLPPEARQPSLRSFVLKDQLARAEGRIESARKELEKAKIDLASARERAAEAPLQEAGGGAVFLEDPFDEAQEDVWEIGPGEWKPDGGKLHQSRTGAERAYLRSRAEHPRDFDARLRFTTWGGEKWRSVGLAFDVAGGREKLVYLSAVSPGSKLQVSYDQGGGAVYPAEGAVARKVSVGEEYDLRLMVRDRLVNVILNGSHALAYQLPVERAVGRLELVAFDAVVDFDSLSVRELDSGVRMVAAGATEAPMTVEAAEAALILAEKRLSAAELQPEALRTAQAADWAKAEARDAERSMAAAAEATKRHELASAEVEVARWERELADGSDASKRAELEKAREAMERARAALEAPGTNYTSLRASLKALEGPDEKEDSRRKPYPATSTGRRAALARWIASENNPLTARVLVNHIWLRHFGQPLVESVEDFGLRSSEPPQRALLDWLAVELMRNGWSMKHVHRLIVTSRTYQLSSSTLGASEATRLADPANRFFWRRQPMRMESQVIRDSLLALAGVLDETMGGPSINAVKEDTLHRRSLYFVHSRDDRHKFLSMFDDADILRCYRRSESVVPQQALTLANSKLALELSRALAARLQAGLGAGDDASFIAAAFETVLGVAPSEEEREICREALEETRRVLAGEERAEERARENLVHALVNHNDFVTIR